MSGKYSQKSAYKFKALSGGEAHDVNVEQGFVNAFHKGYSVLEIARVAGMKSGKYIHSALVKNGHIPSAKPGKQSKQIELPEAFTGQLKARSLSFAQWCVGWSFTLEEAVEGVRQLTGPVGAAVKRDFPHYFAKSTGASVDDYASGPPFERQNFSVKFDWDGGEGCYKAEITDLNVCAYGDSYQSALYLALIQRKDLMVLERLKDLPNLTGTEGREMVW